MNSYQQAFSVQSPTILNNRYLNMAKSSSKSNKSPAASETSESIDQQVKQFLKSGGKIQQINSGVSGQQDGKGPKHISLGKPSDRR